MYPLQGSARAHCLPDRFFRVNVLSSNSVPSLLHWLTPTDCLLIASPRVLASACRQGIERTLTVAAQIGLRVILTMTNFYLEFGGIRWYVDNTISTAAPQEAFYVGPGPIAAYQTWVRMGVRQDPA